MDSAPVVHITPVSQKLAEAIRIHKEKFAEVEELMKLAKEEAAASQSRTGFAAFDKFIVALEKENPDREELVRLLKELERGTETERLTAGFYKARQFVKNCEGIRSSFAEGQTSYTKQIKDLDSTVINVLERFAKIMGHQVTIDGTYIRITWCIPKPN